MKIQISEFPFEVSYVDGPGERIAFFVQGCPIVCPGCQSPGLWPLKGGKETSVGRVVYALVKAACKDNDHGNITISGGEPLAQPEPVTKLVKMLKRKGVKHIILYTGYTWEQLQVETHPANPYMGELLKYVDVIVDGPFVKELDHDHITYRGSSNQRPINVKETLEAGELVLENWDNEIVITDEGDLVMPIGFGKEFGKMGKVEVNRMCGQNEISIQT